MTLLRFSFSLLRVSSTGLAGVAVVSSSELLSSSLVDDSLPFFVGAFSTTGTLPFFSFGLLLFVFVKNYIKNKIQYYLEEKNKKSKED